MLIGYAAAWQSTDASQVLMACVDAGLRHWMSRDPNTSEKRAAELLGVAQSRITAMRVGIDPGPGFLRFASLGRDFWIGFLLEWGIQFGIRIVTDTQIEKLISWLNAHMVRTMQRDAARMYPGVDFPEIEDEKESA